MCITAPGRVLSIDGDVATVDLDGRRRRASLAVLPTAAVGDWVVVGAGTVLRRLDPDEALDITTRIDQARAATPARQPEGDLR